MARSDHSHNCAGGNSALGSPRESVTTGTPLAHHVSCDDLGGWSRPSEYLLAAQTAPL